jgi:hypothetical protein
MPPPSTCHREQRCPHQWQQRVQTPDHQRPDTSVWSGTACAAEPVETNERRRGVGQAAQSSNSYRRCHSCPASSARHCVSLVCVQRDVLPLPMSAFHQPLPCPALWLRPRSVCRVAASFHSSCFDGVHYYAN